MPMSLSTFSPSPGGGTNSDESPGEQNSAPSVANVAISPNNPYTYDDLACEPSGVGDADGDSVSFKFTWTVNGAELPPDQSSGTLGANKFQKGDAVVCIVTPNDGAADGAPVTSEAVTVQNSAPSVANVAISPDPPTTNEPLTATPTGVLDVDGDVVTFTYQWTVNGVAVGGQTDETLAPTYFSGGQTVGVTATPYDGIDYGESKSASAIVQNSFNNACNVDAFLEIEAGSFYYSPENAVVPVGATVAWSNAGGYHNVNGDINSITAASYDNPESFYIDPVSGNAANPTCIGSHKFNVPGVYNYDCSVGFSSFTHAANGMVATITVGTGGCIDAAASNYDPAADFDNGSCIF